MFRMSYCLHNEKYIDASGFDPNFFGLSPRLPMQYHIHVWDGPECNSRLYW